MVLPVVGLQNHHPLITGESLFDVASTGCQLCLHIPGGLLHGIGTAVQGQHQDVHGKAQHDDGKTGMVQDLAGKIEDIFIQENFYFLCDVEEMLQAQELDDYEEEEIFTLEYVSPEHAIYVNENADHKDKVESQTFAGMILRENKVLEIISMECI